MKTAAEIIAGVWLGLLISSLIHWWNDEFPRWERDWRHENPFEPGGRR